MSDLDSSDGQLHFDTRDRESGSVPSDPTRPVHVSSPAQFVDVKEALVGRKRPNEDLQTLSSSPPMTLAPAAGGAVRQRAACSIQRSQVRRLSQWLWEHQCFPYLASEEVHS
jgi:hypothetical protein